MRSKTSKHLAQKKQKKQKKEKTGNSQFTRAKLQEQYKPVVRTFKQNLFSLNNVVEEEKHTNKVQEEILMCDKAVNKIKEGLSIKIDWNTRTNFRTTQSLLPKLKTQPVQVMKESSSNNCSPQKYSSSQKCKTSKSIQEKQQNLRKMLFRRQKKAYLASKQEQEEQMQLFGERSNRQNTCNDQHTIIQKLQEVNRTQMKNRRSVTSPKREKSMIEVQEQILNGTKLKVLRDELKLKFLELRQSFGTKRQYKRRFVTSSYEQGQSHYS